MGVGTLAADISACVAKGFVKDGKGFGYEKKTECHPLEKRKDSARINTGKLVKIGQNIRGDVCSTIGVMIYIMVIFHWQYR